MRVRVNLKHLVHVRTNNSKMDYEQTVLMYGNLGLGKKMEQEPWYSPYQHKKKCFEKIESKIG
jgi:hypothetical protein